MERRITLTDIDRPGEALEVDIIAADETSQGSESGLTG